jgi:predicted permease
VGQRIRLGEETWRVVGVMARDFRLPMGAGELWLVRRGEPTERGINALALLRAGVSIETANIALRQMPAGEDVGVGNWVGHVMAPSAMFGQTVPRTLVMLAVAVGLLLLMACVNVAGLLMSRYRRRQREFALRLSLGASRLRLFRLLMAESAVLAALGGLLGLGTAHLTLEAISALRPDTLRALEGLRVDAGVLLFALGTTAFAALLFGALPAFRAARGHMAGELASGGRAASATGLTGRGLLGAAQIAVALVLLVGTMLLSRSLVRLSAVDPGFAPEGLVAMQLSLDASRYDDADVRAQFMADLTGAIGDLPAVTGVAQGSGLPPTLGIIFGAPELEGRPAPESEAEVFGGGWASAGYFSTLGIEVVEGREFTDADALPGVSSAIVSEGMAVRLAAGSGDRVLGARVRMGGDGDFNTIVGIVADVQANGSGAGGDEQFYLPPPARTPRTMTIAVRAPGDPRPLVEALKARVWALDSELPVGSVTPVADVVWRQAAAPRFGMTLLSAFAAAGLLLAAVGVFGTLALVVAERRREVAVRLSLGATPRQVVSLVTRYVAWITGGGMVVGLVAASVLAPRIQTLLFDVPPRDVGSFAVALVVVALAAITAAVTPVRRMLAVDPAEALRAE